MEESRRLYRRTQRHGASDLHAFADELEALWRSLADGLHEACANANPDDHHLIRRISAVLADNARKRQEQQPELLMERLFMSLPDPAAIFFPSATLFNGAMLGTALPTELHPELAPVRRAALAPFHTRSPLLVPLRDHAYETRILIAQGTPYRVAYFRPVRLDLPDHPHETQFIMLARLSGLPAKQIAHLVDRPLSYIRQVYRRTSDEYQALWRNRCTERKP